MGRLEGPGSDERLRRLRGRFAGAGAGPGSSLGARLGAGLRKQGMRPIRFYGFVFGVLVVLACVLGSRWIG